MKEIISQINKSIKKYNLIKSGDKIAVGVSGGKDSLVLLTALAQYKKYSKIKFEIIAITVDQTNGKTDYMPLKNYCKTLGVKYYKENSKIFDIVFNIRKEKNPCSLCSKMRRGLLNSTAKKLGCNKVALAHNQDDLIETFLLSLIYESRLSTFKPITYLSKIGLTVIRPLIFTPEDIIKLKCKNMPIIENICPVNHKTKREEIKNVLKILEKINKKIKNQIFNAIISSERYNLFDNLLKNSD